MSRRIWIILFIAAFAIQLPMVILKINMAVVLAVSFVVIMAGYLCWWGITNKMLIDILDEKCDPKRFIEECEKKKLLSKKIPFQNLCNTNIAVGLLSLGQNKEALDTLLQKIDTQAKNSKLFDAVYHLALFCCYLNIDDLDNATLEYKNHLKKLCKTVRMPKFVCAFDVSYAEYLYKLNKTPETLRVYLGQLEHLHRVYTTKISTRGELNLFYNKATALEELGDYTNAVKNYKIVAENGNGLWIADLSKQSMKENEVRAI